MSRPRLQRLPDRFHSVRCHPGRYNITLGNSLKGTGTASGTPALGRLVAPAWGSRWLLRHCGSHARTVVQCAHSGWVGLGTRPLVRSQRTVRRYPDPPRPLLSPTLGSTGYGPRFIASRLHHRELRRAGERHRSQHIMGSDRYGVAHALSSRRPPRWTCSSAVWAAASNCYTTLPSSPATAFERGLIAIGTEPRAPRTSHLPSSAPS